MSRYRLSRGQQGLGLNPTMAIMENLTLSSERVYIYSAREIIDKGLRFGDLSIVYVKINAQ